VRGRSRPAPRLRLASAAARLCLTRGDPQASEQVGRLAEVDLARPGMAWGRGRQHRDAGKRAGELLGEGREDALTIRHRKEIVDFALKNYLPSSFFAKEAVEAGGLVSYGANWPDAFRRGATTVDKILKGAKPSDLPVEQPTKFELAVNLKTAKALGLKVPVLLLATADEVIE
jgi:hypothetical protein